ncbi:FAD-dependent oxidoreductase [Actinomadura sp. 7K507]|uniref:FAD-dependent oxidoreductase n=1 Tax=Actinomadura sp. 7K507 TaxID=2530365 RepID=UPI00105140E1|nr:FAD-dependent oxidoreductase [Actinomadura sp. 7K507]TDC88546.1 FAD-dependent oxidoreductase [Actinomadura sp. 7K507]
MDAVDADAEVVVVGAGLAGLAAADELTRAGVSTMVIEARDRPGGRVRATGGLQVGGEFVGRPHRRLRALITRLDSRAPHPAHRAHSVAGPDARGSADRPPGAARHADHQFRHHRRRGPVGIADRLVDRPRRRAHRGADQRHRFPDHHWSRHLARPLRRCHRRTDQLPDRPHRHRNPQPRHRDRH